ncbi:MAG: GNAT family N-acetyltransferase, partial [Cyanobacteria bacterium J06600_6]
INDNSKKIFVSHGKSKTLAYAIVSYGISSDLLNDIQWLDPLLASEVEQNDCLYIDQIAVNPHCLRKNIGREFYEKLIKQSASPTICAFVALEPRCNRTSLKFHESLGFRKAALFQRDEFKGDGFETIENYKSLLLVRH